MRSSCVIHRQLEAFSLVTEAANTCASACSPHVPSPFYADHGLSAKGATSAVQIEPRRSVPRAHAHRPASAGRPPKSTRQYVSIERDLRGCSVLTLWRADPKETVVLQHRDGEYGDLDGTRDLEAECVFPRAATSRARGCGQNRLLPRYCCSHRVP